MGLEVRGVTTLLEVFDMPRSIAFYRDTLGFEVEEPVVREYGMKQLWLTDPDGFRLCFQWPAA